MRFSVEEVCRHIRPSRRTHIDVFNFIIRFYRTNRNGPTLEEICLAVDIIQSKSDTKTSTSVVRKAIERLEKEGKLEKSPRGAKRVPGRFFIPNSVWQYYGVGYDDPGIRD